MIYITVSKFTLLTGIFRLKLRYSRKSVKCPWVVVTFKVDSGHFKLSTYWYGQTSLKTPKSYTTEKPKLDISTPKSFDTTLWVWLGSWPSIWFPIPATKPTSDIPLVGSWRDPYNSFWNNPYIKLGRTIPCIQQIMLRWCPGQCAPASGVQSPLLISLSVWFQAHAPLWRAFRVKSHPAGSGRRNGHWVIGVGNLDVANMYNVYVYTLHVYINHILTISIGTLKTHLGNFS